ncbi:MAG: hypothetical protein U0L11_09600 [Acutalibacteraceae bacterium]|nr:hypothetical protein [Acutalibacteraceae bacterium]
MKKLIAILLALSLVFAFAACKKEENSDDVKTELVTDSEGEAVTDTKGEFVTEIVTDSPSGEETTSEETTLAPVTVPSDDPSTWTDEQIVEFYKAAAIRSKTKVKSVEYKNLNKMVVNDGDGLLGGFVKMVTPILVSALEDSQVEFDGITGGYENLQLSDTQSVKAYKSGEYTVVEMTMKEQIDGAHGERYSGTVGHAISVVGDMKEVEEALPILEIRFDDAEIKLHYQNPKLKVKIGKDGTIEKGTWEYQIYITVANLYVGGRRLPLSATVESAYGVVDYKITVGGGF